MAAQKWVRDSVVGIDGMGMASTKNYKCKKCKKHCVGWKLVKSDLSMPPAIRREFPIVHFPKFTVLREVMSLVRSSTVIFLICAECAGWQNPCRRTPY